MMLNDIVILFKNYLINSGFYFFSLNALLADLLKNLSSADSGGDISR